MKNFILIVLAMFLSSCGPVYESRVVISNKPQGSQCIRECEAAEHKCEHSAKLSEDMCERDKILRCNPARQSSTSCGYSSCSSTAARKQCKRAFYSCIEGCGATVRVVQECVRRCEQQ